MAKFRKKPVVIEAVKFLKVATLAETHFDGPVPSWLSDAMDKGAVRVACSSETYLRTGEPDVLAIKTLEGEMAASPGDWIIQGVQGEIYPCKPDIFAASYEKEE